MPKLPSLIVDNQAGLPGALRMLAAGHVYVVVYIDDWPGRPGQLQVQHFFAPAYKHMRAAVELIAKKAIEDSGCVLIGNGIDALRLGKRGAA